MLCHEMALLPYAMLCYAMLCYAVGYAMLVMLCYAIEAAHENAQLSTDNFLVTV
jgi:hypothetical protein